MEEETDAKRSNHEALLDRALSGDSTVMPELRPILESSHSELVVTFGLTNRLYKRIVESIAGNKNLFCHDIWKRECQMLEQGLAGPEATPIERVLAEQAALCWLALRRAELRLEAVAATQPGELKAYIAPVDSAHRRLMSTLRTLSQIQGLNVPVSVQLNVGENQINMVPPQ